MGADGVVGVGTVQGLFERWVDGPGRLESPAVIFGGEVRTYGEVERGANRFARYLRRRGLEPGGRVALHLEPSIGLAECLLGVLKAGGAYVPIDAADPESRTARILKDSGVRIVVTGGVPGAGWARDGREVVELDREVEAIARESGERPREIGEEQALAYVLYTSGSTGIPKGVAMPHGPLVNLLEWHLRERPGSGGRRTLQACSLSFDFTFHEIFSTLCGGGALVIAEGRVRRDPVAMVRRVVEAEVERLFLPVTLLGQFAEAADGETAPGALREVITTGEVLQITPALRRLFRRTGAILHNHYGATEFQDATTHTLVGDPAAWPGFVPIGRPIAGVYPRVLDAAGKPVPAGEWGELWVGGAGVARGYLNLPELTAERFVEEAGTGRRYFRTGDEARCGPDGVFEHRGRLDQQIKLEGRRVEPGEIEAVLATHPWVSQAVVGAPEVAGVRTLVGYVALRREASEDAEVVLLRYLADRLPRHMVPEAVMTMERMPLTASGKVDRARLPLPGPRRRRAAGDLVPPASALEARIAGVFREELRLEAVGIRDNFFDLGATSLRLIRIGRRLRDELGLELETSVMFRQPTIERLVEALGGRGTKRRMGPRGEAGGSREAGDAEAGIAIIGMACRVPGANDPEEFWRILVEGRETLTSAGREGGGAEAVGLERKEGYVVAGARLENVEYFDGSFFGYSRRESSLLDPQQRVALECAWEAFERAGWEPSVAGPVGVFAGASVSTYLLNHLMPAMGYGAERALVEADTEQFQLKLGNDRNYLPSRISYQLRLRGPSVNVQTACSTGLVAVQFACESLRRGECDMAVAVAASVICPQAPGYLFEEGMIRSPDGRCRPFDAEAAGTVFNSGAGAVVLKRLADARADGDTILAVIRGGAVNNDGAEKVGFTAPGLEGQAAVIEAALADAGVDAGSVSYVEAHGTGTRMGDPLEVAALTLAFGRNRGGVPPPPGSCRIGSVKSNLGHLDEAAGMVGLIKTVLALHHRVIPASLNYREPNPEIHFDQGPFVVNTSAVAWSGGSGPRRAGVSSFGMGGTNCHLVLEEAPTGPEAASGRGNARPVQVLALSARSPVALRALVARYRAFLSTHPDEGLAALCATANRGRRHWEHRLAWVGRTREEFVELLAAVGEVAAGPSVAIRPRRLAWVVDFGWDEAVRVGRALSGRSAEFDEEIADWHRATGRQAAAAGLASALVHGAGDITETLEPEERAWVTLAIGRALVRVWESWVGEPSCVIGLRATDEVAALAGWEEAETAVARVGRGDDRASGSGVELAKEGFVREMNEGGRRRWISRMGDGAGRAGAEALFEQARSAGVEAFVEIGAGRESTTWLRSWATAAGLEWVQGGGAEAEVWATLAEGVLRLYRLGHPVDWEAFERDNSRRRVTLPTYPWTRERCWVERPRPARSIGEGAVHPLLGKVVALAGTEERRFAAGLGREAPGWLADHRIFGRMVLPGVAYLEMALGAASRLVPGRAVVVEELQFHAAMDWADADVPREVQTVVASGTREGREIRVYSRGGGAEVGGADAGSGWTLHATARLRAAMDGQVRASAGWAYGAEEVERWEAVDAAEVFRGERERQIDLGPSFGCLRELRREGLRSTARLELPERWRGESAGYCVHPILLEAGYLALTVIYPEKLGRRTYVPFRVERVEYRPGVGGPTRCQAWLKAPASDDPESLEGEVRFLAAGGESVVCLRGVLLKRARPETMLHGVVGDWRSWLAHVGWQAGKERGNTVRGKPGRWLLVAGAEWGRVVARQLEHAGFRIAHVLPSGRWINAGERMPASEEAGGLVESLKVWSREGEPCQGVLDASAVAEETGGSPSERAMSVSLGVLELVKVLSDLTPLPKLLLVSRGGWAGPTGPKKDPLAGVLGGFGRVLAAEQPEWGCVHLDLDPATAESTQAEAVLARVEALVAAGEIEEREVAMRGAAGMVARLQRWTAPVGGESTRWRPRSDAAYLLTGAGGDLGLRIARRWAERGARHLVMLGRRGPGEAAARVLAELGRAGVEVSWFSVDVADREALGRVVAEVEGARGIPPIAGVLHLAGVLDDGAIGNQTRARFRRVLEPKVAGAWNLHELTRAWPLEFMVFFSSASVVLGTAGQAGYVAANGFLDGLAACRRAAGRPGLSIQWGSWGEIGMAARAGGNRRRVDTGERDIPPEVGLDILETLLSDASTPSTVAVLPMDWGRYGRRPRPLGPLFSGWSGATTGSEETSAGRERERERELAAERASEPGGVRPWGLTREGRRQWLVEVVREELGRILGEGMELSEDTGFMSAGMDSVSSLELRNHLQTRLGRPLPQTVAFDYPNVRALVDYLTRLTEPVVEAGSDASGPGTVDTVARRLATKLGRSPEGGAHV